MRCFDRATGARVNPRKSKALAIGRWNTHETVLGTEYHTTVKILGVTFRSTLEQSMHASWSEITEKVRMQAKNAYARVLCLAHRVLCVNICLSAKIWYTAQIFPTPNLYTRQIEIAITWYIWQGAIFRVQVSTLRRQKKQGEWDLTDIEAKCRALLLRRMWMESMRVETATTSWLKRWKLTGQQANPPHATRILNKLAYLQKYAFDMAYVTPPGRDEAPNTFKRRLYCTLHTMAVAERGAQEIRVIQSQPTANWSRVWRNLHTAWITEQMKSTWFIVIHNIIPANERLAAIRLTDTNRCRQCGRTDTHQHLITECNEGANIWKWTRARLAILLRMDPRHVPAEWTIRPHFFFCPPPSGRGQ